MHKNCNCKRKYNHSNVQDALYLLSLVTDFPFPWDSSSTSAPSQCACGLKGLEIYLYINNDVLRNINSFYDCELDRNASYTERDVQVINNIIRVLMKNATQTPEGKKKQQIKTNQ